MPNPEPVYCPNCGHQLRPAGGAYRCPVTGALIYNHQTPDVHQDLQREWDPS